MWQNEWGVQREPACAEYVHRASLLCCSAMMLVLCCVKVWVGRLRFFSAVSESVGIKNLAANGGLRQGVR